jgi:CRISPR/Cas system-associated exonuclease Cas4 (RecB family)
MRHFSFTKTDIHGGCPLFYKFKYVDKLPEEESEALLNGSAVHEVLADYVNHCLEECVKTDQAWMAGRGINEEVQAILDKFADSHLVEPGEYILEEMWKLPIAGRLWWGVVDCLRLEEKRAHVTDYKSDRIVRSKTDVDKDPQMRDYAVMVMTKYPEIDEVECTIDFVRHGVTRSVTYTRDDLPALEAMMVKAMEAIEADTEFKATPGNRCAWCSWTDRCPAVFAGGGVEVITDESGALKAAEELVALKARVSKLESMLKPYTSQAGNLLVNGMSIGWSTSESMTYPDVRAFVQLLEGRGYEPCEYLRVATTEIKKLMKRDTEIEADLILIGKDASKSSFGTKKEKK